MHVFPYERLDGLADRIRSTDRVVYAAAVSRHPGAVPSRVLAHVEQAVGTNLAQDDLYYLKSILATTGMNANDDFFDRQETWAARKTPEDKPFNYEHRQDDIIGHITDCLVVGADGKTVPDDTPEASLPHKFHVLTTAVLYKFCDVPDRQKRIDQTLAELAEGKWFVSMECLFKGFDYLLVPQDSAAAGGYDLAQAKVVERTDKTAFLTKHLRAYGGSGTWNGHKVGRVLRNILFHGKGLVRKPANPESIIFPCSAAGQPEDVSSSVAAWFSTSAADWSQTGGAQTQLERDVLAYFARR